MRINSCSLNFCAMSYLCKSVKLSFMNTYTQKPKKDIKVSIEIIIIIIIYLHFCIPFVNMHLNLG